MKSGRSVGKSDISPVVLGGGCLVSIPVMLGFGFKYALKYAQDKEHEFAHQVEEVELEGEAAALLQEGLSAKESLLRFVKKIDRVTAQYSKTGARFTPQEFENESDYLDNLKKRLATEGSDPECQAMVSTAQAKLQQYAPPG